MIFQANKEVPLWESEPVLSQGRQVGIDIPSITPYFPPVWKANGKALIIFPGGSYAKLSDFEGQGYAEYFTEQGFYCFVVKNRLGRDKYHHPVELSDGARAVRLVRSKAKVLGIRPDCIGVVGSSAGGHLAATVCNMYAQGLKSKSEGTDADVSSRPDFAVLCYPVLSSRPQCLHRESFYYLLGEKNFNDENCRVLSQDLNVTKDTPPTFLWHTLGDRLVPCENSILYAEALRKAGVPFELHIYEKGSHGQGLFQGHPWAGECVRWLAGF